MDRNDFVAVTPVTPRHSRQYLRGMASAEGESMATVTVGNEAEMVDFAAAVMAVAPTVAIRGTAFLSRIAEALGVADLDTFKDVCMACCRAGHLSLVRCDMVSAFDPRDVAASEARYAGALWHCIHV